jgi:hypothetical protein
MLGRLSRGLGHKSGQRRGAKYRFDVLVDKLDNLPAPVKRCRVLWSRGAKVQMTNMKDVTKGTRRRGSSSSSSSSSSSCRCVLVIRRHTPTHTPATACCTRAQVLLRLSRS